MCGESDLQMRDGNSVDVCVTSEKSQFQNTCGGWLEHQGREGTCVNPGNWREVVVLDNRHVDVCSGGPVAAALMHTVSFGPPPTQCVRNCANVLCTSFLPIASILHHPPSITHHHCCPDSMGDVFQLRHCQMASSLQKKKKNHPTKSQCQNFLLVCCSQLTPLFAALSWLKYVNPNWCLLQGLCSSGALGPDSHTVAA